MKIAIYSRKSVFTGKGESIENQIEMCKNYCKNYFKNENLEYMIYEDEGFSGKNINRPKFQKLLSDIKLSDIDILICYRLDRISRSVANFSSTLELLQKHNVNFISIKEQFDTSTPMGRAMIYIASVFAQLERETIAERIKDNMIQLAKMGKWSGGQLPLGFISEKVSYMNEEMKEKSFVKLVLVDEELDIIKLIYNSYLIKGSILSVVKELNDRGYKSKTGTNFELTGVKRILKSPLYVKSNKDTNEYLKNKGYNVFGTPNGNGYLTYNKKNSKAKNDKSEWIVAVSSHTGLISFNDWLKVQRTLDRNIEKSKELSNRAGTGCNTTLFSGLLKCGKCGSNMVIKYNSKNRKTGENYIYYICSNKEKEYGNDKCDCPNLRTDLVDPKILENIKLYNKETILEIYKERLKELTSDKKVISTLSTQLDKKELQVHNLIMQLSNSPNKDVSNMLMNEISTMNDEITILKQKLENTSSQNKYTKETITEIKNLVDSFLKFDSCINITDDINEKRLLIKSITERVIYDFENKNFHVKFFGIDSTQLDSTCKSLDCYLYSS
jgi:DNA invertase Pin-like site-specific DNA recombinase